MRRERTLLALLLLGAAAVPAAAQPLDGGSDLAPPARDDAVRAAASITAPALRARVEYLAGDALRGRQTPGPGLEEAAAYLQRELRAWGLDPAGEDGTYVQRFAYRTGRLDAAGSWMRVGGETLVPGRDFFVIPAAAPEAAGPLVFAGRAEDAAGVAAGALQGAVAVFDLPGRPDGRWDRLAGEALSAAERGGAVAAVLVLDPALATGQVAAFAGEVAAMEGPLPLFGVRHEAAARVLPAPGTSLAELRGRAAEPGFAPHPLGGARAVLRAPRVVTESRPPNVAALLRGSDPRLRDSYVVVTAHFDHVGVGAPDARGDSIYNGADDNASGTAALLEVARALASLPERPARSVLFLAVSGEEHGLLGSRHFAEHPTLPREAIVANVNLDMIGRNAPDTLYAVGFDFSTLGARAARTAEAHPALGLRVVPDPRPGQRFFQRSDHYSFARKGIPALGLTTGLHPDYHRPSDHADRVDADKQARIARLVLLLVHDLANDPARPEWTERGRAAAGLAPR
jgi:hypothetical protein